jgi:hypothetical protein
MVPRSHAITCSAPLPMKSNMWNTGSRKNCVPLPSSSSLKRCQKNVLRPSPYQSPLTKSGLPEIGLSGHFFSRAP